MGGFILSATRLPESRFSPALGSAPRPYDRFALVEDEEATGLTTAGIFRMDKLDERVSGRKGPLRVDGLPAAC
jgi:hypothetical protein